MATITVSSTSQTTTTKTSPNIHFDPSYAKSIPGILKIAEAVVSVIGFICVQTILHASYMSAGGWYSFVAMSGFWIPLLLIVVYIFHIVERLSWLPWLIAETGFAAIWCAFFFIAACVAAANGKADNGWGAAAFFGFVAMLIFGYEAFLKYKKWRNGDLAQGERTTTSDTSTTTAPSYPTY